MKNPSEETLFFMSLRDFTALAKREPIDALRYLDSIDSLPANTAG